MSHRSITSKKVNRLRKSLRHTPPAYIDMEQYIRLRTRCTAGVARGALLSGQIKAGSHAVTERFIPASQRDELRVDAAEVPA